MIEEPTSPWDWAEVVRPVLEAAGPDAVVLDQGVGEGRPDNVVSPDRPPSRPRPAMPHPDAGVDVVLNRCGSFDPDELARVVRAGGWFVTEQVGHDENASARALLGLPLVRETWDAAEAVRQLVGAGWDVTDLDEVRAPGGPGQATSHRFRVTARRPG